MILERAGGEAEVSRSGAEQIIKRIIIIEIITLCSGRQKEMKMARNHFAFNTRTRRAGGRGWKVSAYLGRESHPLFSSLLSVERKYGNEMSLRGKPGLTLFLDLYLLAFLFLNSISFFYKGGDICFSFHARLLGRP